tara:strand:- start:414 stop:872 length:459 start_codon:yes stop_codon:yes gene_type:complete
VCQFRWNAINNHANSGANASTETTCFDKIIHTITDDKAAAIMYGPLLVLLKHEYITNHRIKKQVETACSMSIRRRPFVVSQDIPSNMYNTGHMILNTIAGGRCGNSIAAFDETPPHIAEVAYPDTIGNAIRHICHIEQVSRYLKVFLLTSRV